MNPFPSINQYRNAVKFMAARGVTDEIDYLGTVKLHGTNAAVVYMPKTGQFTFQSRNRIITPEDDNAGFAAAMTALGNDILYELVAPFDGLYASSFPIIVYGEWCGGNIQSGVGISGLEKMFVVFDVKVGEVREPFAELDFDLTKYNIYSIYDFPTFTVKINFNDPGRVQNTLIEITEKVEERCPVAAVFGVDGVGEGVVWRPVVDDYGSEAWFKVKGEKHSISKVKTLAAVDVETLKAMDEFIEYAVTQNRLEQGLCDFGKEVVIENLGDFIRWVYNDIVKEESDVIEASLINTKKLGGAVAKAAKTFYFKQLEVQ